MAFAKSGWILIVAGMLAVSGCDKLGIVGGNDSSASVADTDAGKNLDGYIEAYNALLGTMGFEKQAQDYRESNIPDGAPGGEFRVSPGWIDQGLQKLQTARAMPNGDPQMESAADAVLRSTGKVQSHLASLQTYYQGKKYLDDDFARGKAENGPMLAEIDAAERDIVSFGKLLEAAIERRDLAVLDKLKGSDPLGYNTKVALIHSKKLLDIFNGQQKPSQPDLIAKGDAEVAIIEKAITEGRQEAAKSGKPIPQALDLLNAMLGYYREFKRDRDPTHLNTVLTYYNGAIEAANH